MMENFKEKIINAPPEGITCCTGERTTEKTFWTSTPIAYDTYLFGSGTFDLPVRETVKSTEKISQCCRVNYDVNINKKMNKENELKK